MATLRLARLPERTPVRLVLHIPPQLEADLQAYAVLYEQHYGRAEAIADLVPAMLESFLGADRTFQSARKTS